MDMVEAIRAHLAVPAEFGTSVFHLHFTAVAPDRLSGEDVTLGASDEGDSQVHLAHSEWVEVDGRRNTSVLCSAVIDWSEGGVRYVEGGAEQLRGALEAGAQMERVA